MDRKWYLAAAFLVLAGVAGAWWLLSSGLAGSETALARTIAPGSAVLTLREPGSYTIFYEMESVLDGRVFSPQDITGLKLDMTAEGSGAKIPLIRGTTKAQYSFSGHRGVSVLSFEISEPGRYRLDATYPEGRTEPQAVLAIGSGFVGHLLGTMFGAFAVGLLGVGGGVALAVVTLVRRRQYR